MAGGAASVVSRRQTDVTAPGRRLLHWGLRLTLLTLLLLLTYESVEQYRQQPVISEISRLPLPFPRLTVCAAHPLRDYHDLRERQRQLANGSITVADYYNQTTLEILRAHLTVGKTRLKLTGGRQRFYLQLRARADVVATPVRCHTFEPNSETLLLADNWMNKFDHLPVTLDLIANPHFTTPKKIAYRVFLHSADEPNVDDLDQLSAVDVPGPTYVDLKADYRRTYRISARMERRVDVDWRPCSHQPGYSMARCQKEFQWRRLAARTGCRLPHMVSTDLPDLSGPLDHLPFCEKLVQERPTTAGAPRRPDCSQYRDRRARVSFLCSRLLGLYTRPVISQQSAEEERHSGDCSLPEEAEQVVDDGQMSELSGSQCRPACQQTVYSVQWAAKARRDNRCHAIVEFLLDRSVTDFKQTPFFTLSTLFANIGGFMGLVFGYSLFALADFVESAVFDLPKRWSRRSEPDHDETNPGGAEGRIQSAKLCWKENNPNMQSKMTPAD